MLWEDNYLAHYGVKGMRWGVRKAPEYMPVTTRRAVNETSAYTAAPASTSASKPKIQIRNELMSIRKSLNPSGSSDSGGKKIGSKDTTGQFGRGNIDLNKRKVVKNKDGSISTERSFSTNIDGKEVLLPTVINGRIVSEDEAIEYYMQTGENLGQFDTVEEAEQYAEELHNRQDWYYNVYKKANGNKALEMMLERRREAEASGKGKYSAQEEMKKRRESAESKGKGKFSATEEMRKRREEAEKRKQNK